MNFKARFEGFECRYSLTKKGLGMQNCGACDVKECLPNFLRLKHVTDGRTTQEDLTDQLKW